MTQCHLWFLDSSLDPRLFQATEAASFLLAHLLLQANNNTQRPTMPSRGASTRARGQQQSPDSASKRARLDPSCIDGYSGLTEDERQDRMWQLVKVPFFDKESKKSVFEDAQGDLVPILPKDLSFAFADMSFLLKGYRDKCAKWREKASKLEKELAQTNAKLARAREDLHCERSRIDELALKQEINRLTDGTILMPIFRQIVFPSSKCYRTADLVNPDMGAVIPGPHQFPNRVFENAFKYLEMDPSKMQASVAQHSRRLATSNVYSQGKKHAYNNPQKRRQLWFDVDFHTKIITKLNSKRNQQSCFYRSMLGALVLSGLSFLAACFPLICFACTFALLCQRS